LKHSPILTIGIPTFNRCSALDRTLGELAYQIEAIPGARIEVLVSDNCSTDNTEIVVRRWIDGCSSLAIRHIKNSSNIGFDANCHNLFLHSSANLVWLLSDDDFLQPNAINKVYRMLESAPEIKFAFVNYDIKVNGALGVSGCRCSESKKIPGLDVLELTGFAFSFVSSCIFNRDSWIAAEPERYFGTFWIHMYVARDILIAGNALLIAEPLITMNGLGLLASRMEKRSVNTGIDFYVAAHMKFVEYACSLQSCGYGGHVSQFAKQLAWGNNLRQIIYFKSTASEYRLPQLMAITRLMSKYFKMRPLFWLVHIPVLFSPNKIISFLYFKLLTSYKKIKSAVHKKRY